MRDGLLILIGAVVGVAADRLWNPLQRVLVTNPLDRRKRRRTTQQAHQRCLQLHGVLLSREYERDEFDGTSTLWKVVDVRPSMYFPVATLARIDGPAEQDGPSVLALDPRHCLRVYDSYSSSGDKHMAGRYRHRPLPTDRPYPPLPKAGDRARVALSVDTPAGLLEYAIDGTSRGPGKPMLYPTLGDALLNGRPIDPWDAAQWLVRVGRMDLHTARGQFSRLGKWAPEPGYCHHAEPTGVRSTFPRP